MTPTVERLKSEIQALSPEERAELAQFLAIMPDLNEEDEIKAAWDQELERRVAEIENGRVNAKSGEEVFEELRRKYPR